MDIRMEFDSTASVTRTLHELTSYDPDHSWDEAKDDPRLLRDFIPNDLTRRPWPLKQYSGDLPRVRLPRELPAVTTSTLAALAGTARPAAAPLDLAGLSRLLHLSAGVVRTAGQGSGTLPLRAAGSAGGRFPLELYLAIPQCPPDGAPNPPPGVHWYDAVDHALVRIAAAPRKGPGPTVPTVIVTGIPWRTAWRYRERGFRHVYWDTGTMLSQLLTLADSAGIRPRLYSRFPDAAVSALVGADQVHEWPTALVTLGDAEPAIDAHGKAAMGEVDFAPVEFPLVTAAQRAGEMQELAQPWPSGAAVDAPPDDSSALDEVILKRGSQRRMDPGRGLPLDTLRSCMSVALRGTEIGHWIAVHHVDGLAPGIYRWPDLHAPYQQRTEEQMRAQLHRVCLGQTLARDAAFVVIAATDGLRLSDRGYREAQLAAGIVEGRLHLAAYALGAAATGMTFMDSEIPALLNSREPLHGLIFTCVGVPANTTKPGGPPGKPTTIRMVSPRT